MRRWDITFEPFIDIFVFIRWITVLTIHNPKLVCHFKNRDTNCVCKALNISLSTAKGPRPSTWRRTWRPAPLDPTSTPHPAHQPAVVQTGTIETEVISFVCFTTFIYPRRVHRVWMLFLSNTLLCICTLTQTFTVGNNPVKPQSCAAGSSAALLE